MLTVIAWIIFPPATALAIWIAILIMGGRKLFKQDFIFIPVVYSLWIISGIYLFGIY